MPKLANSRGRRATKSARSKVQPAEGSAHPGTKQTLLIDLLKRKNGATIAEAVNALGWQPHSVRGAISGTLKKKLGLNVTSAAIENRGRVYQIAPRAAGRASRR